MPTPSPNSAATPPDSAPRDPPQAAEPSSVRAHRQVILDVEKVGRLLRPYTFGEVLAASRNRLTPGALHRVLSGLPVRASIAEHLSEVLGVKLADIVSREVEEDHK